MRRYCLVGSCRRLLEVLNFIDFSEDTTEWRVFVNMIVNFVLNKMLIIVSCARKILLRIVRC